MPIVLGRKGGASGGGAPSGPAGGDLSGTFPNPEIGAGTVGTAELSTAVALQLTEGWVDDTAATWTRTADQTFTVTGDRTAVFSKGTRLKWTQTTVKYGVVVASSHAAGTTTVTIATTTDYVLTAAAISANYYSYAVNPQGYPGLFNWTVTWGGFSAAPTAVAALFSITGKVCTIYLNATAGTSNATTMTFSLPALALSGGFILAPRATNNSVALAPPAMVQFNSASATADCFRDGTGAAWTASGTKLVAFYALNYTI